MQLCDNSSARAVPVFSADVVFRKYLQKNGCGQLLNFLLLNLLPDYAEIAF